MKEKELKERQEANEKFQVGDRVSFFVPTTPKTYEGEITHKGMFTAVVSVISPSYRGPEYWDFRVDYRELTAVPKPWLKV